MTVGALKLGVNLIFHPLSNELGISLSRNTPLENGIKIDSRSCPLFESYLWYILRFNSNHWILDVMEQTTWNCSSWGWFLNTPNLWSRISEWFDRNECPPQLPGEYVHDSSSPRHKVTFSTVKIYLAYMSNMHNVHFTAILFYCYLFLSK